jgi:WD40 repeat protein
LDKTVKVWDVHSGREILTLNGHTGYVSSVVYSPDGRHIVSGGWDDVVKVWDARTGQEIRSLLGHTDQVMGVAHSPDGGRIVSASVDRSLRVWNVADLQGGPVAGR